MTRFTKRVVNPVLLRLAGHGRFADVEHIGRKSGTVYHTPVLAFSDGDVVTMALTYGPKVDWLANLTATHGGHLRLGDLRLTIGPPTLLDADTGLPRMPNGPRQLLPILGCTDFVEFPILREEPWDLGS